MNEDWKKLQFECAAHSKRAKVKSKLAGFYDGTYDAKLLPLHQMCALDPPKKALVAVIQANPRGVWKREHTFERLPLHIACINSATDDVILTLLSYYKQAAEEKDIAGRVPLHYACCNDVSSNVIKALLEAHPEGAKIRDDTGWLPVHVACTSGVSLEVIKMLLLAQPQTIVSKTKKGSTPLACAKTGNCHNMAEIIAFLLKFESEFFKAKARTFMNMDANDKKAYLTRAYKSNKVHDTTQKLTIIVDNASRNSPEKGSQAIVRDNYHKAMVRSSQSSHKNIHMGNSNNCYLENSPTNPHNTLSQIVISA